MRRSARLEPRIHYLGPWAGFLASGEPQVPSLADGSPSGTECSARQQLKLRDCLRQSINPPSGAMGKWGHTGVGPTPLLRPQRNACSGLEWQGRPPRATTSRAPPPTAFSACARCPPASPRAPSRGPAPRASTAWRTSPPPRKGEWPCPREALPRGRRGAPKHAAI